jgi:hypothetical protein
VVVGARTGGGAAFTLSLPLAGGSMSRPPAPRGVGAAAHPAARAGSE